MTRTTIEPRDGDAPRTAGPTVPEAATGRDSGSHAAAVPSRQRGRFGRLSVGMVLVLAALQGCCSSSTQSSVRCGPHHTDLLPSAGGPLDIPDLGPCSDSADRRLYLTPGQPVTVLVHGCKGSAGRFRALAEVFAFHGQQTVGFSYDDRDGLMATAERLARALAVLAARLPTREITVIGHSQGGLIARKALVQECPSPLQGEDLRLRLVTISAPFSGIAASRHCGSPVARTVSLGLVVPICWFVTGDKWRDITYASPFITEPGNLLPQVVSYLKIDTDERNTCRRIGPDGRCLESDQVFSLEEQVLADADISERVRVRRVSAGHVEIIGDREMIPTKLIAVLQEEGVLGLTDPLRQEELDSLLAQLYGSPFAALDAPRVERAPVPQDDEALERR